MATSASSPGRRSSPALWAGLLVVAAFAWVLLIRQSPGMPAPVAGPWLAFGEFLLLWVVMMAAMMLPSAAPAILLVIALTKQRGEQRAKRASGEFAFGYVAVWGAFSLIATGLGNRPPRDLVSRPRFQRGLVHFVALAEFRPCYRIAGFKRWLRDGAPNH